MQRGIPDWILKQKRVIGDETREMQIKSVVHGTDVNVLVQRLSQGYGRCYRNPLP